MLKSYGNHTTSLGLFMWFLLSLIPFIFINPFEIPIWRDRAYLAYMSQTIFQGEHLYETTPFGYTPLAPLVAGYLMRLIALFIPDLDTIHVLRILGIVLYASITGSFFYLAKSVLNSAKAGHLVVLAFLGIGFLTTLSATNFEPKMLALLFEIWALHYAFKKKWIVSGIFFSLAAMCWQPMVINCLVLLVYIPVNQGINKRAFTNISRLALGVFIGSLPCLVYLSFTNDWLYFWNQAVVRKVGIEGAELLESPFSWLIAAFVSRFKTESLYFILGALGFLYSSWIFLTKKKAPDHDAKSSDWIPLLLALSIGWALFNSLEFQGPLDLVPIIPFVLLFAVYLLNGFLSFLKFKAKDTLLIALFGIYSFHDYSNMISEASYSDQREWILKLQEKYGDVFVVNFEEFYVLQEKRMPTKYMRYAGYEDFMISSFEDDGCESIKQSFEVLKHRAIIALSLHNKVNGIGDCAYDLINTYSDVNEKEIVYPPNPGSSPGYEIYRTRFHKDHSELN